jgi:hypothetical protein
MIERRLLQLSLAAVALPALSVGGWGVVHGPFFLIEATPIPTDFDSHFRFLSGVFVAIGLALATCIPEIERKGASFRLLGLLIVGGGLARLVSLAAIGTPSRCRLVSLAVELGIVPLLMLWQVRIARLHTPQRSIRPAADEGQVQN